jgi:hypothetical protein
LQVPGASENSGRSRKLFVAFMDKNARFLNVVPKHLAQIMLIFKSGRFLAGIEK